MDHEIEEKKVEQTLSWREKMAVEEHEKLSPRLVYEIIRRDGAEELDRPTAALIFSGIAAGLVISFSFVFKAIIASYIPTDAIWTDLITNFGYTIGFLIAILGHMQLFTENTITTVVPLFKPFSLDKLRAVGRLWGIVILCNIIGTALASLFFLTTDLFTPDIDKALDELAHHVASFSAIQNLLKGVMSGLLIAALVWMLPSVSNKFLVIFFMTYLIGLGDFTHVVVGSTEMSYLVWQGEASLGEYLFNFLIPTTIGNIIGGTGVFTLLIYGQVTEELD
ncbi:MULTISPECIES: formate/nitrite transporter family protein [Acinetobacter]|jgi:formate/nitrite transporter FocA (FNT family)|uniref:Formate/nitrite transporter family protein n=1 Tax=Acinetobacter nosocomialis 28F TaxID=1147131 RepID=A0AA36K944_ACINO|nr:MULTISPECIES: formate/nitrite transporter family protein [Acinetobacter]KCX92459.1 formate/nitrite transporter family protein [Acinetobacter baumannii 6112]MDQ9822074.1 formate/nitrite transporter family protein [Acinetobacter sp. 163]EHU1211229.1 formate/nitrite transporter family protein [Acinetobacter nosocomialis]EXE97746.1 formate/nitrite transporter family protein [Acinetobacter sp. 259052]EXH16739.1 formate/nitrite transporter family protein [Acinetobacter sp. 1245593]